MSTFTKWFDTGVRLDRFDDTDDFASELATAFGDGWDGFVERNDDIVAVWSFEDGHVITEYEDACGDACFTAHGEIEEYRSFWVGESDQSVREALRKIAFTLWENDVKQEEEPTEGDDFHVHIIIRATVTVSASSIEEAKEKASEMGWAEMLSDADFEYSAEKDQ